MKSIYLERAAPYILGFASAFIWLKADLSLPDNNAILSASLTLGAILTGFMATSKAILMTLDSPIMQRLRETDYIGSITSYLGAAIWITFTFCLVTLAGLFVDNKSVIFGVFWIFLGTTSAGAFIRVTNIMLKIIQHHP